MICIYAMLLEISAISRSSRVTAQGIVIHSILLYTQERENHCPVKSRTRRGSAANIETGISGKSLLPHILRKVDRQRRRLARHVDSRVGPHYVITATRHDSRKGMVDLFIQRYSVL